MHRARQLVLSGKTGLLRIQYDVVRAGFIPHGYYYLAQPKQHLA
jgi:hypothetical protein